MQSWAQFRIPKVLTVDDNVSTAAGSDESGLSSPQLNSPRLLESEAGSLCGEDCWPRPQLDLEQLAACNDRRADELHSGLVAFLDSRRTSCENTLNNLSLANDLKSADLRLGIAELQTRFADRTARAPTMTIEPSAEDIASTNDLKAAELCYQMASLKMQQLLDMGLPDMDDF